jgi:acyl-coenzyme A thioesterase PaaI-like protein
MQSVTMPWRAVRHSEIETGVSEARIEFDRPARQALRAVARVLVVEQVAEIAAST